MRWQAGLLVALFTAATQNVVVGEGAGPAALLTVPASEHAVPMVAPVKRIAPSMPDNKAKIEKAGTGRAKTVKRSQVKRKAVRADASTSNAKKPKADKSLASVKSPDKTANRKAALKTATKRAALPAGR